tara:strand:+ start:134 stop:514 length:381 start_codon:yes stop_codon:yes gene_type:complete
MPAKKSNCNNKLPKSAKKKKPSAKEMRQKLVEEHFDELMELMEEELMEYHTRQWFMVMCSGLGLAPPEIEDMQEAYQPYYEKFHALLEEKALNEEQLRDINAILSNVGDESDSDESDSDESDSDDY